jgi:hypothetical protein
MQHTALRLRDDGAREVRALLAVRHELGPAETHEQAGIMILRVIEHESPADGEIVQRRDPLNLRQSAGRKSGGIVISSRSWSGT